MNFSDEEINLQDVNNYRNLSKPMGALLPNRASTAIEKFKHSADDSTSFGGYGFHYGSHYSNPGIVIYYLLRLMPYTEMAIDL